MKLTKIRYDVKGRKDDIDIRPVTLITGDNQAGKSSAALAITETIAPTHGFPWLSGGDASAELLFESGRKAVQVERRFSPDHTLRIDGKGTKLKDGTGMLAEKFGTSSTLSVQSFAELTAQKRAEAVLLLASTIPEGVPKSAAELRAAVPASWWQPTAEGGFGLKLPMAFQPTVFVPWVSSALADFRSAKAGAAKAKRTAEEVLKSLVLMDEVPVGTLPEAKRRRAELDEQIRSVREQLAAVQRSSETVSRLEADIAAHRESAEKARVALAKLATVEIVTAKHGPRIAEANAAKAKAAELESDLERLESDGSEASKKRSACAERVAAAREAVRLVESVLGNDACPTCGEALRTGTHAHDRLAARASAAAAELEAATAALTEADDTLSRFRAEFVRARDEARTAKTAADDALRRATIDRDAELATLRRDRGTEEGFITQATAAIEALEKQLAATPRDIDPDLLSAQAEGLAVELERVDVQIEELTRYQTHEADRVAKTLERDAASDRFTLTQEAEALLKGWRDAIAGPVIGRLESTAKRIVSEVFPDTTLRVVLDDSGKGATMVFDRDGLSDPIPFAGWSGSERAVAGIAAHVAMLEATEAPWKVVICDEIQVCAKRVFPRLVSALVGLVEDGTLDNVLLIGSLEDHVPTLDAVTRAKVAVVDMDDVEDDDEIEEAA